jgi:hypothetical protein
VRELLEQLNLHTNEAEPVIICRICQFTLSGSIKSLVDHVDKHKHPRDLAKDLGQLLRPYTIVGPKELRLRSDHAPPHPHLSKHLGMMCKYCGLKTTSAEILAGHLSKEHSMKRKTATWLRCRMWDSTSLEHDPTKSNSTLMTQPMAIVEYISRVVYVTTSSQFTTFVPRGFRATGRRGMHTFHSILRPNNFSTTINNACSSTSPRIHLSSCKLRNDEIFVEAPQ